MDRLISDFAHPAFYDALIDWPKRLANETPFYRDLFEKHGVRSVLDAACGTGRHVALFHSWGLVVEGADLSAEMVEHARPLHGESDTLRWVVRGFDEPCSQTTSFDALICVGNSLALAADTVQVGHVLGNLLSCLRPGGLMVIQVLNLWSMVEGATRWSPAKQFDLGGRSRICMKGLHRCGPHGYIDLIEIDGAESNIASNVLTPSFLGIEAEQIIEAIGSDAGNVELYGSFQRDPYDRASSTDLIAVITRA